jgi:hypothetical protein
MFSSKHLLLLLLIAIILSFSVTEENERNYSETTTKYEVLDEESDDSITEDIDYESYNTEDDRYPDDNNIVNTKEINSLINKVLQKLPPIDKEENVLLNIEKKNTKINDTIDFMLGSEELFSNSIEAFFKTSMPLFMKYFYEVSY